MLLQLAQPELDLVRARWTNEILDEAFRSLLRDRPDLVPERLERTRELMCRSVPDCLVEGYSHRIDALQLPDPDDRHVLAAAIHSKAAVIVTKNLKDYPADVLAPFGIEARPPDAFVLTLLGRSALTRRRVLDALRAIAQRRRPELSLEELWVVLERRDFPRSVAELRVQDPPG